jgi:carbon starvation protein
VVTRVINPSESVNALWLVVAAACFFIVVYRLYGSFVAAKILALDDRRITPAIRLNDGKDYHPTHTLVLFGHHFAAMLARGR